jgi:hypothetical protein
MKAPTIKEFTMATTEEKIAKLKEAAQKTLEKANRKKAEAVALERQLRQKTTAEDRKKDTRRKILVGSMGLERAAKYPDHQERLLKELDKFLTRDDDRALFKLGPVQANVTATETEVATT